MSKASTLDVLVVEHSALKRKVAVETFVKNRYRKLPKRGHYSDDTTNWVMLKRGKVKIKIEWPKTDTFPEKRVARKKK